MTNKQPKPVQAYAAVSPDGELDNCAVRSYPALASSVAAQWYGGKPKTKAVTILPTKQYEAMVAASLVGVWSQARDNHETYSATGSVQDDIRFFSLGLAGEAGEVANFVKKDWRDATDHNEDLRKEVADVLAYTIMLADALGMSAADLVAMVAHKQQVFIDKMHALAALKEQDHG